MLKINDKDVFIHHCIYRHHESIEGSTTIRNVGKYIPLPVVFRKLLFSKYLRFWHVNGSIERFGKSEKFEYVFDVPLEFTVAQCPEEHTDVIAICHPTDQFKKRTGVKIVKDRMKWALEHPDEDRIWVYRLK